MNLVVVGVGLWGVFLWGLVCHALSCVVVYGVFSFWCNLSSFASTQNVLLGWHCSFLGKTSKMVGKIGSSLYVLDNLEREKWKAFNVFKSAFFSLRKTCFSELCFYGLRWQIPISARLILSIDWGCANPRDIYFFPFFLLACALYTILLI